MTSARGSSGLGVFSPLSDSSSVEVGSRASSAASGVKQFQAGAQRAVADAVSMRPKPPSVSNQSTRSGRASNDDFQRFVRQQRSSELGNAYGETRAFSPLNDSDLDRLRLRPFTPAASVGLDTTVSSFPSAAGKKLHQSLNDMIGANVSTSTPFARSNATGTAKALASGVRSAADGCGDGLFFRKASAMISKSTQTGDTRISTAAQGVQADFVRGVVEDCLEDFEERWRDNLQVLYAKMLRQQMESEQRLHDSVGVDCARRLADENERLRAENERLKALHFGKFGTYSSD